MGKFLTQAQIDQLDLMLVELTDITIKVNAAINYYEQQNQSIPFIDWYILEHDGGWSVGLRMGMLTVTSGFDFQDSTECHQYMEWLVKSLRDLLRTEYGVELGETTSPINPN